MEVSWQNGALSATLVKTTLLSLRLELGNGCGGGGRSSFRLVVTLAPVDDDVVCYRYCRGCLDSFDSDTLT